MHDHRVRHVYVFLFSLPMILSVPGLRSQGHSRDYSKSEKCSIGAQLHSSKTRKLQEMLETVKQQCNRGERLYCWSIKVFISEKTQKTEDLLRRPRRRSWDGRKTGASGKWRRSGRGEKEKGKKRCFPSLPFLPVPSPSFSARPSFPPAPVPAPRSAPVSEDG